MKLLYLDNYISKPKKIASYSLYSLDSGKILLLLIKCTDFSSISPLLNIIKKKSLLYFSLMLRKFTFLAKFSNIITTFPSHFIKLIFSYLLERSSMLELRLNYIETFLPNLACPRAVKYV